MLDRFTIAESLRELALLLSLKGENKFKVRAYERGAEALEKLEDRLDELVREDRLTEVPDIGKSIASITRELYQTGSSRELEQLRAEIPRGVVELTKVEGLGDQKIRALHKELGVDSVESLKHALETGVVLSVKGFGPKTVDRMREAIDRYEREAGHLRLLDALETGERILRHVKREPATVRAEFAGELRRWHESIGELEVVAASTDPEASAQQFTNYAEVVRTEWVQDGVASVRLAGGFRAKIVAVAEDEFAKTLIQRTGSAEHVARLSVLEGATEEEIYRKNGLNYVPPELRENVGEIEAAAKGSLTDELLVLEDVRGMVHCHTQYSDGRATIEEMARAADELGIEYMTITDHSPSAFYARGVEIDRLKAQWDELAAVQERVKVKLLRGTEADILADGALDYPDEILEKLDVVIASIHSRFKMDVDAMTERITRAMKHPLFKIWGHPLGRLIMRRDPIACRVEEILDVIAGQRAAIEISGDPNRLDMEPRWVRAARERKIPFVVSVDAHSTRALGYLRLGVQLARRAGVKKGEVLNVLPTARFMEKVRPVLRG